MLFFEAKKFITFAKKLISNTLDFQVLSENNGRYINTNKYSISKAS